jgi:hypothetical protein
VYHLNLFVQSAFASVVYLEHQRQLCIGAWDDHTQFLWRFRHANLWCVPTLYDMLALHTHFTTGATCNGNEISKKKIVNDSNTADKKVRDTIDHIMKQPSTSTTHGTTFQEPYISDLWSAIVDEELERNDLNEIDSNSSTGVETAHIIAHDGKLKQSHLHMQLSRLLLKEIVVSTFIMC